MSSTKYHETIRRNRLTFKTNTLHLQKTAQKQFLEELLNKKKIESLESLSLEEIQKQLDDLK